MELTSRHRAMLRRMANTIEPILFIGKDGVTDYIVKEAYDALEARELVKGSVQSGCSLSAKDVCALLCRRVHAYPVQCVGKRFVLYRESRKNKRINLL